MDASESHDLHRLTALVWDASVPISFTVNVPGLPPQAGHFLVPRMIPVHLCTKPMFEKLASIENAQFGTDKFKGWFEYRSRFNKNSFSAVIPWALPIVTVVDWLTALEFPNEVRATAKDPIEKMFEDNALPLELKYVPADQKVSDDVPCEAILQSQFLHCDKQFAHKLWFSALLGSASEAVKLPPNIERSLRSWDAHTFFRGRRDLAKRVEASGSMQTQMLCAFHIVEPITSPQKVPVSMRTALRLVDTGAERCSTFGQLLKQCIFQTYARLSSDACLSTEPLASELGLVRVLGLNPPLYTPVAFLRDNMCARDFALHIVVRPLPDTGGGRDTSSPLPSDSDSSTLAGFSVSNSLALSTPPAFLGGARGTSDKGAASSESASDSSPLSSAVGVGPREPRLHGTPREAHDTVRPPSSSSSSSCDPNKPSAAPENRSIGRDPDI